MVTAIKSSSRLQKTGLAITMPTIDIEVDPDTLLEKAFTAYRIKECSNRGAFQNIYKRMQQQTGGTPRLGNLERGYANQN